MKYTVVWKPAAERELALIWADASDRNAVSAAAAEIDRLLRSNPVGQGEARGESFRVTLEPPLVVFFHINERDRLVSVVQIRRTARGALRITPAPATAAPWLPCCGARSPRSPCG